jgi:hypothetical protein
MVYEFLAKSSGSTPYQVVFTHADNKLGATCNCGAGIFGKLCKHKLALLQGDTSMLFEPAAEVQLQELLVVVKQTSYPEILADIRQAELAESEAKKNLDKRKKTLEKALKEGA